MQCGGNYFEALGMKGSQTRSCVRSSLIVASDKSTDRLVGRHIHMKLVAIDFETADYAADSACALGIVLIENGKIRKKVFPIHTAVVGAR